MDWTRHLLVVPILLPLVTGASLLLIDELRHTTKALINIASTLLLLVVAMALMHIADAGPVGDEIAGGISHPASTHFAGDYYMISRILKASVPRGARTLIVSPT